MLVIIRIEVELIFYLFQTYLHCLLLAGKRPPSQTMKELDCGVDQRSTTISDTVYNEWYFPCNGNTHGRAQKISGALWTEDPGCYKVD